MFQAGLWLVLGLGTVWPGRPGGPLTDLRPDSEDPNASNRRKAHLKNTTMMQKQRVSVLYQRRRALKTKLGRTQCCPSRKKTARQQ